MQIYHRTFFCHVKIKVLHTSFFFLFLFLFFPFRNRWSSFGSSYRPVVKIGKCLVVRAWPSGTRRREQAAGRVHELKDSLWLRENHPRAVNGRCVSFLSFPPAVCRPRVASRLRISARSSLVFSFGRSSFILDERQSSKRV